MTINTGCSMSSDATDRPRTVVLCLGNELLADDGVGILAARLLRERLGPDIAVIASAQSGMALIDLLTGYERAVIIDAIQTGSRPAGSILRLTPGDLREVYSPSPHYAGLPEMFAVARQLALPFPSQIDLVAIEITDAVTVGGAMSVPVAAALQPLVSDVEAILANDHIKEPVDA